MRRKGTSSTLPSFANDVEAKKKRADRRALVLIGVAIVAFLTLAVALKSRSKPASSPKRQQQQRHRRATDRAVDDDDDDGKYARKKTPLPPKKKSNPPPPPPARPEEKLPAKKKPPPKPAKRVDSPKVAKKADPVLEKKEAQRRRIEEVTARVQAERARKKKAEVSVVDEHHHVLAYYVRAKRRGLLTGGATVLHVDSHADLGMPETFPDEKVTESRRLEEFSEINDFLVLGAHVGLFDHIVFVEPPWSNQFRCCVYEHNATFEFVVGVDASGELRVDLSGSTARDFERDRFGHVFWRNGERRMGDRAELQRSRPFKVTLIALEHPNLGAAIAAAIDPAKPVVLDVDLDAFATVSPGAIATKARFGLDNTQLETLYHLVWNFPPLGIDYLSRSDPKYRDERGADDFVMRAAQTIGDAAVEDASSRLAAAVGRILDARHVDARRRKAVVDYAAAVDKSGPHYHAAKTRPRPLDARSHANLEAYLEQPFHVPDDIKKELDFVLDDLWRPALVAALPAQPFMIHLVRSPGYMPDDLLPIVECRVLDFISELYDTSLVTYEHRVDVLRTNCAKPRSHYVAIEDSEL
ncbi:hypothetical protein CTAYLR_003223 [Chrysophaeum taylorii]|uniref:Uncharacterized protein n=1 Tax=Chrysophaeum taylorii TaxID=2483200 RepID=A0AAD7UAD8_9STRA|nr:hypothetical protein CTAYLR_003223 [Chrysophaeum taylorii]